MAGDTTAPTLSSATPGDNATGVAAAADIVLTFSEAVKAGSGNITITDGGSDVRVIPISDPQVTIGGSTVTINPTADLHAGTPYDVIVPSGAITDPAGNAFAGIAQDALDFTTAGAAVTPWINELHYDNSGTDTGEFIEIAGAAGTNLSSYSLVLYNGDPASLSTYNTTSLSGVISNQQNGSGLSHFLILLTEFKTARLTELRLSAPGIPSSNSSATRARSLRPVAQLRE